VLYQASRQLGVPGEARQEFFSRDQPAMTLWIRLFDRQNGDETIAVRLWYNQLKPGRTSTSVTEPAASGFASDGTGITMEDVDRVF
jgi:hypothetical protein